MNFSSKLIPNLKLPNDYSGSFFTSDVLIFGIGIRTNFSYFSRLLKGTNKIKFCNLRFEQLVFS